MTHAHAMLTTERLDTFALLKDNWDNKGARAPYPEIIDAVREILPALQGSPPEHIPEAYVSSEGQIELLWRDIYVCCEVFKNVCNIGFIAGAHTTCDHKSIVETMMRLRETKRRVN